MAKKLAFVYSHGGSVFDKSSHDGFNERGRNIVRSIKSAIESGADKVFVSEAVYPGKSGQINLLLQKGFFRGFEDKIDASEYLIAENVEFPKNYLMNRAAQKADGFFGLVFSDSDVLYESGFQQRALKSLEKSEFCQPDHVVYLNPFDQHVFIIEFTMKLLQRDPEIKSSFSSWKGMPGLCNIVRRDSFLSIGGFSQAISGVNMEDVEYFVRLKMLGVKMDFMENEVVRHLYHSRSFEVRKSEGLPSMFLENTNFIGWWYSYLRIQGNTFDKDRFKKYLSQIQNSLESNKNLRGPYANRTGTITPEFDPNQRYKLAHLYCYADPWSENAPKDVQCAAIIEAANFWRVPVEEALRINKEVFVRPYSITIEDIYAYQKKSLSQPEEKQPDIVLPIIDKARIEESEKMKARIRNAIRAVQKREGKRSESLKKEMKAAIGKVSEERKKQSKELSERMKRIIRKKIRPAA